MFRWQLKGLYSSLRNLIKLEVRNIHKSTNSNWFTKKKSRAAKMDRKWEPELKKSDKQPAGQQYRILSYNILAQDLLVDNMFLYYDIDQRYLRWQFRIDKLRQEVNMLKPDILCIQEMQQSHLKQVVRVFSSRDNGQLKFEYVFKKRTGNRCDGCAIIYDRNKFQLIAERFVEYYDDNTLSNRENVALLAKFQIRGDPSTSFVAVTTHLLYNPRRNDVRICQINKLVREIIQFSKMGDTGNIRCPVILTGDFNCTSDSAPFRILTSVHRCSKENTNHQANEFQLEPVNFGTDCASTFQNQWMTVDYILKSCSQIGEKSIIVSSTYRLPKISTCITNGKMPNKSNGSDHFSLAIQFTIV